jgi:hypothetical protein
MAMNSQASTSSGTMTTIEGYTSCWRSIEGKAMMMGITLMEINGFHKEMQKVAELRFGRESPYWRRWFAEASVWARFCRAFFNCSSTQIRTLGLLVLPFEIWKHSPFFILSSQFGPLPYSFILPFKVAH